MKIFLILTFIIPLTVLAQSGQVILQNSVVAFDQATCPSGWSQVSEANGRVLIGAGSGNVDSVGNPLTPRTLSNTGGLEYTTGIPASTATADTPVPAPDKVLATGQNPSGPTNVDLYTNTGTDSTIGFFSGDSNIPPYTTIIFCKRP